MNDHHDRRQRAPDLFVPDILADLLLRMIRSIVDEPDAVTIHSAQVEDIFRFVVVIAESDMGRVIGRQGRMANSFRVLGRGMGLKFKTPIEIEFESAQAARLRATKQPEG